MTIAEKVQHALTQPFGSVLADQMAVTHYRNGSWDTFRIKPLEPLQLSPGAHVFHYSSECFEGLKIHRWDDGSIHAFRLDRHLERFQQSANMLCLPVPSVEVCRTMITELADACREWVPQSPGTLYVRPTLIGTEACIGAAATPPKEVMLFIVLSPVGDYFKGGARPLRLLVDERWRTSPETGLAKTGGNYAAALKIINDAKRDQGVDQVLFAPDGEVQETGAANFMLINDHEIVTKPLDSTFLHGVTRDSVLTIARDIGYSVHEQEIPIERMLDWVKDGEAALTGTAAVLASVGTLVYQGREIQVGDGQVGPNATKLRNALLDVQKGRTPDQHGWLSLIQP